MTRFTKKAVLINDTRVDRHHGCAAVVENLTRLANNQGIEIIATSPAHQNWQQNTACVSAIETADLVIVNGEGTLHSDKETARWLLDAGEYSKSLGKPAVLVNSTWHNNSAELFDKLRNFQVISMRESQSRDTLKNGGINAHLVPDLAILSDYNQPAQRNGIGFTDCVVGQQALGTYIQMWRQSATPVSIFYECRGPRAFARSTKRYLQAGSLFSPSAVYNSVKGAATDQQGQFKQREAFLNRVSGLNLLVTGRFHAMIFAMATETPFLVVASNTPKNQAVLKDSGLAAWRHVDPSELNTELLNRAAKFSKAEQTTLASFKANAHTAAQALFADIRTLLD